MTPFASFELCRRCGLHRSATVTITRHAVRMTFDCGHTRVDELFHSPHARHLHTRSI